MDTQKIEEYNGVNYQRPKVFLLNNPGIGISEIAARTCYDSYSNSEHESIKNFNPEILSNIEITELMQEISSIESSELLDKLAWVHFHHSILEHINLSYFIKGTSRGVLQEHARHRIQSISVRSTRYTMSDLINLFLLYIHYSFNDSWFIDNLLKLNMFVTTDTEYNEIQAEDILQKLIFQYDRLGSANFLNKTIHKDSINDFLRSSNIRDSINILNRKKVKNIGNSFKHVVNDNWKVDLVCTFNIRSLKNYFDLRDSLAAWFQIQWLAQEMQLVTPEKYLALINKEYKHK